ncbi:hypothetical protein E4J89_13940 [Arthrobacter sp. CAU 1506]|uniref:hypothetical protein n=1 Tax=Arthrobacter sp. CAU 1506 TaxID=2560052 RepID=UPI0010AB95DB|nr:hypothetical protein [Arthrobacter sp. CAU 1506]TJY67606.1 hypothetical protein E4J89_13940 [Arthrobacter sp. CAU 1506]
MDYEVNALPLHVLLVHATVVFIPLTALCIVLSVLWPAARRRLGIVTPLMALFALVLVPVSQQAGHWLFLRIDQTPLAMEHMRLGDMMLPWVIGLFITALGLWLWFRYGTTAAASWRRRLGAGYRIIAAVLVVVVLAVCAGATVAVVLTGESGSRAVWEGRFSEPPPLP